MTRPATFATSPAVRRADVEAALDAVKAKGLPIARVELIAGKAVIVVGEPDPKVDAAGLPAWDGA